MEACLTSASEVCDLGMRAARYLCPCILRDVQTRDKAPETEHNVRPMLVVLVPHGQKGPRGSGMQRAE